MNKGIKVRSTIFSIDACEENGNFVIAGEVVENENETTLKDVTGAVEANADNNPDLEGITYVRK